MGAADREILYRLRGDTSQYEQAIARADAALGGHERTLAGVAQQLGRTGSASVAYAETQQQTSLALQRVTQWERTLESIRAAGQSQQRTQFQAQQQFVTNLQHQADSVGKTRSELLAMQAAQLGVTAQAQPFIDRLAVAERGVKGVGTSGKYTAQQMQQLGFQLNDLAVQVVSGGNPLVALVQQGSQLSGAFGGVGGAARAVLSVLTPVRVLIGGVAGGVMALAAAYVEGYRENAAFETALLMTGNRAGVTAQRMDELTTKVARNAGVTVGAAREAAQAVVGTGRVGPAALEAMSTATALWARRTGQDVAKVVEDFAGMANGVARWAAERNKSLNFLTAAQYQYIRTLELQGKTEQAMLETSRLISEHIGTKLPHELGALEQLWRDVKDAASQAWDSMKGAGRPETTAEALKRVGEQIKVLKSESGTQAAGTGLIGQWLERRRHTQLAEAQQEQYNLQERDRMERGAADRSAQRAEEEGRKIEALSEANIAARLDLERTGIAQREALADVAREREMTALERQYERAEVGYTAYLQRRAALEQGAIDAKRTAIDAEIALEKRREVKRDSPEATQREARLVQLQTQRIALQKEQIKLDEQVRQRFGLAPRTLQPESPQQAFRQLEHAQDGQVDSQVAERRVAAAQAAHELFESNRSLNVQLIRDDRQRGQAQIALEEEQWRQRLDVSGQSANERARIEGDLANWRVLRERELTEQLMPEWERQLRAWSDLEHRRKEVSDEVNNEFLSGGKQAFGDLFATGKFTIDRLGQAMLRTLGEQVFERFFAQDFKALADVAVKGIQGVLGMIGGVRGDSAATATQAAGQAAGTATEATAQSAKAGDTAAITAHTTALTAMTTTGVTPAATALTLMTRAAELAASALARVGGGGAGGSLASAFAGGAAGSSSGGGTDLNGWAGATSVAASTWAWE
jgi:phage-related minor tail protein